MFGFPSIPNTGVSGNGSSGTTNPEIIIDGWVKRVRKGVLDEYYVSLISALADAYVDGDLFLLSPGPHEVGAHIVSARIAFAPWNGVAYSAKILATPGGDLFAGWLAASAGSILWGLEIQVPSARNAIEMTHSGADLLIWNCRLLGGTSTAADVGIRMTNGFIEVRDCEAVGGTSHALIYVSSSGKLKTDGFWVKSGTMTSALRLESADDFVLDGVVIDDDVSSTQGILLGGSASIKSGSVRVSSQPTALQLGTNAGTSVKLDSFVCNDCAVHIAGGGSGSSALLHLTSTNVEADKLTMGASYFENADILIDIFARQHQLFSASKRLIGYFDTVTAAIAAAVDDDRIGLAPIDIEEEITLNKRLTLYCLEGPHSARFVGSVTGSHRVYVTAAGCEIHDVEIMNPPSAPFNGLLCSLASATDSLILVGCRFYGPGGGNSVGALITGGGVIFKDCYWMEGGFSKGLEIRGITSFGLMDGVKFLAGTYGVGVHAHTNCTLKCESLTILETCTTTDGLQLGAARIVIEGTRIEDCSGAGLRIIADGLDLDATNLKLVDNTGYDILIDPLLTGAGTKIKVLRSTLDASKINAPIGWAETVKPVAQFFEEPPAGSGRNNTFKDWGADTSNGAPWHNSESVAGFGQSSDANAVILRETALGVIDNISAAVKAGTPTAIFSDTASGAKVYFGFPWRFNNLKARWTAISSPKMDAYVGAGALVEWQIWDGGAWVRAEVMWRMSDPGVDGKKRSSGTECAQSIQSQHMHIRSDSWKVNTPVDVAGAEVYWVRAVLQNALTTSPLIDLCKWGLSRVEQDGNGLETYGDAQSNAILIKGWNRSSLGENTANVLPNTDIKLGINPVLGGVDTIKAINNRFQGGVIDGLVGAITVPWDFNSAEFLHLDLNFYSITTGSATARFHATVYIANEGDIMGSLVGVTTTVDVAVTDVLDARTLVHVDINLNEFPVAAKAESVIYIAIHRDGAFDAGNDLVLADSHIHYYSWRR